MKNEMRHRVSAGFSLVEMLVVIAVIGILTALAVPAFQGIVGVSGVRGGVDLVMGTLESARNLAVEKDVDVYVGFLPEDFGDDPADAASHLIVFREATPDELVENPGVVYVPESRWLKLPTGVMMSFEEVDFDASEVDGAPETEIPQFDGQDVSGLRVIKIDRFGRIVTGPSGVGAMYFDVGDALHDGTRVRFKGNQRERFTAHRLTGRWEVRDLSQ